MVKVKTAVYKKSQKELSKNTRMAYLISMIVGIVGLVAYVVLGTFIENPYLDVMLIFAVPFGFGLVFYITINKNIKR